MLTVACTRIGATTLPDRRRSSTKTMPPTVVATTALATAPARPKRPLIPVRAALSDMVAIAGSTCHTPNSAELHAVDDTHER